MRSFYPQCRCASTLCPGFTLVELMVAIAILAVLAAIAAPGFKGLMERWHVRQSVESLQSTLYYARAEAVKRGGRVVLYKNAQGSDGCREAATNQEWGCGWFVFVDTNKNGTLQASEEVLQRVRPSGKVNVMRSSSGAGMKFDRYGMAGGNNTDSFVISPVGSGISSPATTTLCMAAGGRIRTLPGEARCW